MGVSPRGAARHAGYSPHVARSVLGSLETPPQQRADTPPRSHRREAVEYWVKFWGSFVALLSGTIAIVYGVGGWVLDRQSRSVALAEHRVLESKIEQARVDLRREMSETLDRFRRELADQHAQLREDQRETQRRIDSLVRSVRSLERTQEALP